MVVGVDNMWVNVHAGNVVQPWDSQFSWDLDDTRKVCRAGFSRSLFVFDNVHTAFQWSPMYTSVHRRPLSLPDAQPPVIYYQPSQNFVTTVRYARVAC